MKDPRSASGEKLSEVHLRLTENALAALCEGEYLELTDLFHVSQVCRGWYVVVEGTIKQIGLQGQRKFDLPQKRVWESLLVQRHSKFPQSLASSLIQKIHREERARSISKSPYPKIIGAQREWRKTKKDYAKELVELKCMLTERKQIYDNLVEFQKQYKEHKLDTKNQFKMEDSSSESYTDEPR